MAHSAYANSNGKTNAEKYYIISTIGMSIIADALESASYLFISSSFKIAKSGCLQHKVSEGEKSFAFISGTGLDIIIQEFELDLDPEKIRNGFYTIFCRRMI